MGHPSLTYVARCPTC